MEKKYTCPDCGEEMTYGYIFPQMACSGLIWAPPECFKDGVFGKKIPFKEMKNISDKGLQIPLGNDLIADMTGAYCCRRCGNTLIKVKK
ncbi:MAG: PF20097 family protein [Ruminococcus sp.]|nr:PF20097 family protein [Ruminococcus sp.]